MSVDAAFEQLRRANPEPDPAALRRQLHDIAHPTPTIPTRSDTMQTPTTTIEPQPRTKAPRRWLAAFAAGALVLLLGVPFFIFRSDGGLLGLFSTTPVEIAESYMEAQNAWDAERAKSLLAEDVVMNDVVIRDLEELEPGFEWFRLNEFQFSPFECREVGTGAICDYMMHTTLQRIVDYPPVPGSFLFDISEGRITHVGHNFNFTEFSPNVFSKWTAWLDTEHPGAFDQLYRTEGGTAIPRLTPEALDLLPGYLAEYDEWLNGPGG
jgi:hypothetical protein